MRPWIEVSTGIRVTGDGLAWLPSERTIVVADIHLGYDLAASRRGGYLPPVGSGASTGSRLAGMAAAYDAVRIVVAGDLRHSTRDVDDLERAEVAAFAEAIRERFVLDIVRGNHDAGIPLAGDHVECISVGAVDIVHAPPRVVPSRVTICGHLHPRVTLRDETGSGARYPCVLASPAIMILPAFSEWAGGTEASRLVRTLPDACWRALPVHDGLVADVGVSFDTRGRAP
jgi:uncharacterized protein